MIRSSSSPSSYHNPLRLKRAFGEKNTRRIHARYPCDLAVEVWSIDDKRRRGRGRLLNIGMGGGLLETSLPLEKNTPFAIVIIQGQARFAMNSRLARAQPEARSGALNHYGISFILTKEQENKLKTAVEKRRVAGVKSPADDNKMKWFWWY